MVLINIMITCELVIDRKRNLFFLVIITRTMIMEPSKLRFSMFVSLCFFVIALVNIHSPFWRLSCVRDAQTVTQWVSGLLKSHLPPDLLVMIGRRRRSKTNSRSWVSLVSGRTMHREMSSEAISWSNIFSIQSA